MSFSKDALLHKLQDENEMLRKLWAEWEDVPDEDLWEDGELGFKQVERKIIEHLQIIGDWKLIRRIEK